MLSMQVLLSQVQCRERTSKKRYIDWYKFIRAETGVTVLCWTVLQRYVQFFRAAGVGDVPFRLRRSREHEGLIDDFLTNKTWLVSV